MLLRNVRMAGFDQAADIRIMHGEIREIGVGLMKGLYESEADLQGDFLTPGRICDSPCVARDEAELRRISRAKRREGFAYFRAVAPAEALDALRARPEKQGARLAETAESHLRVGLPTPLARRSADGRFLGPIDEHFAD